MATRVWRVLDKFALGEMAKRELGAEPGTTVEWDPEPNGTQVDAYIQKYGSNGSSRDYVCSMNAGGQIEEIHPDYAEYFGKER